jgi:L-lactate utilization protein LutB
MFRWLREKAIDRELIEILDQYARVRADASLVRNFLLRVLADNRSGVEKFSEEDLQEATEIIERVVKLPEKLAKNCVNSDSMAANICYEITARSA